MDRILKADVRFYLLNFSKICVFLEIEIATRDYEPSSVLSSSSFMLLMISTLDQLFNGIGIEVGMA